MNKSIEIDPDVIRRLVARFASSPTLRFFVGPFTQSLEDLQELAGEAGLEEDLWEKIAMQHQARPGMPEQFAREIAQLANSLVQLCEEEGREVEPQWVREFAAKLAETLKEFDL